LATEDRESIEKISVGNTKEFRCLSLCTGYAGIELGLKRAIPALRTIAYVEIEAFACANLVAKIEANLLDAAPVWTDIKTFPARYFRNRVHIITAGYPCQPFSCAGKRKGTDDPRYLWPHIERIIKTIKPIWFFGENVMGHIKYGFADVYRSLRKMGYSVEAGLFSAAECGAPHLRRRLFFLAHNTNCRFKTMSMQQEGQSASGDSSSKLADTENTDRRSREKAEQSETRKRRRRFGSGDTECYWPAAFGQQQYEWEEPRVMDDTRGKKRARLSNSQRQKISKTGNTGAICNTHLPGEKRNSGRTKKKLVERSKMPNPPIKPRLGRATNGTPCRMDRLQLLGNGVVPQQAEKAFRELMRLFE